MDWREGGLEGQGEWSFYSKTSERLLTDFKQGGDKTAHFSSIHLAAPGDPRPI